MSATDTRAALVAGVLEAWKGGPGIPQPLPKTWANFAVGEVIEALQSNPAWAKSLGIGQ